MHRSVQQAAKYGNNKDSSVNEKGKIEDNKKCL